LARWLSIIGIGLQLLGAVCVAIPGGRSLWREALFDPIRAFIWRTWQRLTAALRGRRVAQVRGATDIAVDTDSVRAGRSFAPLADDLSDAAKIAELDRRIQAIITDTGRLANQMSDRIEAQERRLSDLSREFSAYAGEQAAQDRKRAVRQLQVQAIGLFFVTIGSFLQAAGSLLPSENNSASTSAAASESRPSQAINPTHGFKHSPVAGQATGGLYHPGLPVGAIVAAIPN